MNNGVLPIIKKVKSGDKMKSVLKISFVYVGLVIGAGFASGREIMEYFNIRSNTSIIGILSAAFVLALTAYMIMEKAADEKTASFDGYIESVAGRAAPFVKGFMLLYMFCGMFTMFSGSSALFYSVSVLPKGFGAVIMAILCFVVLSFDIKGIVAVNSIFVPIMICGIVYTALYGAIFKEAAAFSPLEFASGEIVISGVCYAAYNTLTAGAVLVPLAEAETKRTVKRAAVTGGFITGILIFVVWFAQGLNFDALWNSDLPMLEIAALCGKHCKRVYVAVLFMAISTTAISYGFGLMSYFLKNKKTLKRRIFIAGVICVAALPFSVYGFANLVEKLYSFFGYTGMIWILWIIIDKVR